MYGLRERVIEKIEHGGDTTKPLGRGTKIFKEFWNGPMSRLVIGENGSVTS